jgi:hypothetical protein
MAAFAAQSAQQAGSFLAVVPLHDALSAVSVHERLFAQRADWMFPALRLYDRRGIDNDTNQRYNNSVISQFFVI